MTVDRGAFRDALARWASGVAVVTTVDGGGRPWGFTASAFSALSLEPPLVLVCLDRGADCYPAFLDADGFAVNVLGTGHEGLARRFATRGEDKFRGAAFDLGPLGVPVLVDALAVIVCRTVDRLPGGDHTIFLGAVRAGWVGAGEPLVYFERAFRPLAGAVDAPQSPRGAGSAPCGSRGTAVRGATWSGGGRQTEHRAP